MHSLEQARLGKRKQTYDNYGFGRVKHDPELGPIHEVKPGDCLDDVAFQDAQRQLKLERQRDEHGRPVSARDSA